MGISTVVLPVALLIIFKASLVYNRTPYAWMPYDAFDEIDDRYNSINAENCKSKPASDLKMPFSAVTQKPLFNKLLTTLILPNRTKLVHLHNMALNRAFYFSYILQKLDQPEQFPMQPGLMYYYFSTAADVSANEYNINGSGIFYDNNCSYANWFEDLKFNYTLGLFGMRTWRLDNYLDPTNWLREPTNRTLNQVDYGAGQQSNYTEKSFKTNDWYYLWLPDGWDNKNKDSTRKYPYNVGIKYSNATGKFVSDEFDAFIFYGPPNPGQKETEYFPVTYTAPYYDCGRANRWLFTAASPIVDWLPRYLNWSHIRRHTFAGISTMDIEFLQIDINPCPMGIGNDDPNYFVGTAKCKENSLCEPLLGWGFRRGGYLCHCRPGYRYPNFVQGPWKGYDIEMATEEEYKNSFNCIHIELQQIIPVIRNNQSTVVQSSVSTLAGKKKKRDTSQILNRVQTVLTIQDVNSSFTDPAGSISSQWSAGASNEHRSLVDTGGVEHSASAVKELPSAPQWSYLPDSLPPPETSEENYWSKAIRKVWQVFGSNDEKKTTKHLDEILPKANPHTKFRARYVRDITHHREKRASFDQDAFERMNSIFTQYETTNADNCNTKKPEELELPGDTAYSVDVQFATQARIALRLSHFLCNFLQNIDEAEEYGNLRGDNLLNVEQLFGEALANVMGDLKIKGSGIFYDIDKFKGPNGELRQYFGPYAYRYTDTSAASQGPGEERVNTNFRALDYAGLPTTYLDKPWFRTVKERWQANTFGLELFTQKPMIRSDKEGSSLKEFILYPMYYRAPKEKDGWWSAPYFDCDGYVNEWVITYAVPFFGKNSIGTALEFKGVVKVDIRLSELDIHQCPMPYDVANAFKNTARCHLDTTYCDQLPGRKFRRGVGYKCECLQAYEYPFFDFAWFFDGQQVEAEYNKKMNGDPEQKYDAMKCRIAGSSRMYASWTIILSSILVTWLYR